MTEAFEDGNHLVRVRAQVMTRDDSTGGWVPMGGGGLSNVSVRKRVITCAFGNQCKNEYIIFGKRISDQSVVLSCIIKKDFEYNKVMPTFHHWKTGEKKFGLTFQTAADARAFDKGLRTAVDELLDGIAEQPPAQYKNTNQTGEDDVFMSLNLPSDRGDTRPPSESSMRGSRHPTPTQEHQVQKSQLISSAKFGSEQESPSSDTDNYPYVQLSRVQESIYQNLERLKIKQEVSSGSLKKRSFETIPVPLPVPVPVSVPVRGKSRTKEVRKVGRQRCRYCQELFVEEENEKGACEYAPDYMRTAVDEVGCVRCARCMLYHCMADAEGDFAQHPCECNADDNCGRRWLGLALLSVLVPCLWLYPPLRACHWCGVRCGVCGGRHRPAS